MNNIKIPFFIFSLLVLISCSENPIPEVEPIVEQELTPELLQLKSSLDETAEIVRDMILEEKSIINEVSNLISKEKYADDLIRFEDLLDNSVQLKSSSLSKNNFRTKFNEVYHREIRLKSSYSLQNYLIDNDVSIYEPYPLSDYAENNRIPTIVSHPITNDRQNIGYEPQPNGSYKEVLVTDEYAIDKPIWIIKPEDTYSNTTPPASTIKKFWLKENVAPEYITQDDVMTTIIPHMRLTDHYVGVFTGASVIRLYKIYGKVSSENTIVNFDSQLAQLGDFKFKRKDIRKDRWKSFNIQFDDDWDVTESDVMFVVISRQGWFSGTKKSELTLAGSLEVGYDTSKDEPSTTAKGAVKFEYKIGSGERLQLRYKDKISRRSALANVVGNQFRHGEYANDGTKYAIRAADKLRFYFMHNITKVEE